MKIIIPERSPLKLDIMFGENWGGQITFPCIVGIEYSEEELKSFARLTKPSLEGREFDLIPTAQPVFKNV